MCHLEYPPCLYFEITVFCWARLLSTVVSFPILMHIFLVEITAPPPQCPNVHVRCIFPVGLSNLLFIPYSEIPIVLGKFGSVQVFALFFSTPNQTGVPFGGSFDSEVWINLKKPQTGLRVQFGVWQKRA